VALGYPSPYFVALSSLGYQCIYGCIQRAPAMACERFFLPDRASRGPLGEPVRTYEGLRPVAELPVIALSVAYELELGGIVQLLEAAGIAALACERDDRQPLIIAGGPLTFANPWPLGALCDAVIIGEADELAGAALAAVRDAGSKTAALQALAGLEHVLVPALHGPDWLPAPARCDDRRLPACSVILTPETELSDMLLIEAERGCGRSCGYCVMRRRAEPGGGMRTVPKDRLLGLIPETARRVGLVGAAVSDHPEIVAIVTELAERGVEVGLSSLRPDRLTAPLVGALAQAGYRTLTTALDGASERLRAQLDRRTTARHLTRVADLSREHRFSRLKLYLMLGVPGETDADVTEGAALVRELSRRLPVTLSVSPFCAKRGTPLEGQPYAGIATIEQRLARLREALKGRVQLRCGSARWGWVEHALAQGGPEAGRAVREAVRRGGSFAAYRQALTAAVRP